MLILQLQLIRINCYDMLYVQKPNNLAVTSIIKLLKNKV